MIYIYNYTFQVDHFCSSWKILRFALAAFTDLSSTSRDSVPLLSDCCQHQLFVILDPPDPTGTRHRSDYKPTW